MWKKFKLSDLKFNRNYTLSQQIVILITSVMCLALLPTSLFKTYRKYLEFLKSLHLLKLDLHRGSVGRPVYKYLCLDKQSDILRAYIS